MVFTLTTYEGPLPGMGAGPREDRVECCAVVLVSPGESDCVLGRTRSGGPGEDPERTRNVAFGASRSVTPKAPPTTALTTARSASRR
ncbi:hypothetical protein ASE41_20190 [Streptomyces sp. Root264]|nr:hypothetical protein ASE41_20190 [Streptomyces sp. Root264]